MYVALRMFYSFCVRLCTDFAHVGQILRTYTDYLLCKLCGFCVRIRIFVSVERLCVRIRLIIFSDVQWRLSRGIQYWGLFDLLLSVRMLVIYWKYWWYNIKGTVEFIFRASCLLLLDRLEDPIFMVPSSYFSNNLLMIHRPILTRSFLVDLDRAIYLYRWSNITVHYAALW